MTKKNESLRGLDHESLLWVARVYLALFFIAAAVSQLFAFEAYPGVIEGYNIPLISDFSVGVAILLVGLEVAAIPVLLQMKWEPRFEIFSTVAGLIVLGYWLAIGLYQGFFGDVFANTGLFGSKILLPQGWWLVWFTLALIILYVLVLFYRPRKR